MKLLLARVAAAAPGSPPSRGAWIEICCIWRIRRTAPGRPPRGGRGLKSFLYIVNHIKQGVAPLAGGVD